MGECEGLADGPSLGLPVGSCVGEFDAHTNVDAGYRSAANSVNEPHPHPMSSTRLATPRLRPSRSAYCCSVRSSAPSRSAASAAPVRAAQAVRRAFECLPAAHRSHDAAFAVALAWPSLHQP